MSEAKLLTPGELEIIRARDRALQDAGWISRAHRDRHRLLQHIEALEEEIRALTVASELESGSSAEPVSVESLEDVDNITQAEEQMRWLQKKPA